MNINLPEYFIVCINCITLNWNYSTGFDSLQRSCLASMHKSNNQNKISHAYTLKKKSFILKLCGCSRTLIHRTFVTKKVLRGWKSFFRLFIAKKAMVLLLWNTELKALWRANASTCCIFYWFVASTFFNKLCWSFVNFTNICLKKLWTLWNLSWASWVIWVI